MKQLTNTDYTEGFTTDLSQTQEKIIKHIKDLQPVCRKVVKLNAGSYADSTIDNNLNQLIQKNILEKNMNGAFKLTEKAHSLIS